jgi:hypothetical protein
MGDEANVLAWMNFALKTGPSSAASGFLTGFALWSAGWIYSLGQKGTDPRLPINLAIGLTVGLIFAILTGGIVASFGYLLLFMAPWPAGIRSFLLWALQPDEFDYRQFISSLAVMLCAVIVGWDFVREHRHSRVIEGSKRLGIACGAVLGLAVIACGILAGLPWRDMVITGVLVLVVVYGFFRLLGWIADGFLSAAK